MKKNEKITQHFKWAEFLHDSVSDVPEDIQYQLRLLAQRLQVIRDVIGQPIRITSGYRSPEHNARVGGHRHSYHVKGMAADFIVDGTSPNNVQQLLKNWSGGMGCYATFTHVDTGPTRRWT